jgi:hypothetical protein
MARAGDGTYSLPVGNPVVSGTTITTSWANTTFTDMATALTNSLDRTGTATGMTGQFKAAAGTKAAPGISWGDETASGWYRAASGDFRFSLNNTDLLLVAEDTFSLTSNGATSAAGPDFVLYRNSATPADADLIGRILFDGMNSAAAQTTYVSFNAVMEDVTDTTEDATLQIKVMSAGTLTTVLDVSPAGGTFSGGINNTPIGAVTPSTGAFTTLTASGTLGVTGATTLAALSATTGTFSSTLGVTGATTLAALSATTGTFSSTLGVTGAATFSSTVAGAFNGTLGATTPASVAATTGTFSGVVTANAGVVVDNFTLDGTTLALSSGDMTLDVAGDINLDSDTGYVLFKDAGTEHARIFQNNSGDVNISSQISDKDMKFLGNDGGVGITALTLDMSAAGAATFNAGITATTGTFSGNVASSSGMSITKTGVSAIAYDTKTGTNASSAAVTWYDGVNVFATDGSYEIKGTTGNGLTLAPTTGAATFSGTLVM